MTNDINQTVESIWILLRRIALTALIALGGAYVLLRIKLILASVLVAVVLTYILLPTVNWLSSFNVKFISKKTRRMVSTIIVFIVFIAIVAGAITIMVAPFQREIAQFQQNIESYTVKLEKFIEEAGTWYSEVVPVQIKEAIGRMDYTRFASWITAYVQRFFTLITSSIEILLELFLIPVLAFYFVLDYKSISREFYGFFSQQRRREAVRFGRRIGIILQKYVFGQLILCLIAGILTGIFLGFVNMPYVLVLALFSGITRGIPIIGPVVSGIPIILIGFLNSDGYALPLYLLIFVTIMHFAESKFIMPRLIGDRLHLHPAVVIVVLLIGAEFFGLIGMFLAAPVAAIARDLIRYYYILPKQRLKALNEVV